ncbi:MAG: hypothetical protein ACRBBN_10975 [Methyloligellaceae bacterium]
MASMKDFLNREIQLQRRRIQGDQTQDSVGMDQALEEFEIEFQCIKKILDAENPVNEFFYLTVVKSGWNDFIMNMRVERRVSEVVVEESVYRGQKITKEKTVGDGKMTYLGGTRVLWVPEERKWGHRYDKDDGTEGFHIVGSTEMLLDMFLDYATKRIAKVLEVK